MYKKYKTIEVSRPGFFLLQRLSDDSIKKFFELSCIINISKFPHFFGSVDSVIRRIFSIIVHDSGCIFNGKFSHNTFKIVPKKK